MLLLMHVITLDSRDEKMWKFCQIKIIIKVFYVGLISIFKISSKINFIHSLSD